jgi:hypothetical protein
MLGWTTKNRLDERRATRKFIDLDHIVHSEFSIYFSSWSTRTLNFEERSNSTLGRADALYNNQTENDSASSGKPHSYCYGIPYPCNTFFNALRINSFIATTIFLR